MQISEKQLTNYLALLLLPHLAALFIL